MALLMKKKGHRAEDKWINLSMNVFFFLLPSYILLVA